MGEYCSKTVLNGIVTLPSHPIVLETKAEALAILDLMDGNNRFKIKSLWVVQQYREFLTTGRYPYLSEVTDNICIHFQLMLSPEQKRNLETLVYNAADIVRREDKAAAGWVMMNEPDYEPLVGKRVEYLSDSFLGEHVVVGRVVKITEPTGRIHYGLLPKRCRRRGMFLNAGDYIRIPN
jgi:hypothetical protein